MNAGWHEARIEGTSGGAVFSPCRKWRYALFRRFAGGQGLVAFIGLNPSTADETLNDPTVTRCCRFAERWGFEQMVMLNLFAYRATDPRVMRAAADPVGRSNDAALVHFAYSAQKVIACWGNHGRHRGRSAAVRQLLAAELPTLRLHCLGITGQGEPKHPLYLRGTTEPRQLPTE